ncbi:siroheme decarboxylase subunit beta [Moorella sp. Hama-1]|uniref:siroheme decarboxylase subunit beta n=1 Tax=Moorella sp. Hama-1 TaxID=2138101 RepID=UPI001F2178BC|nr:Lrp/AsnC family transcriptional regulator [Moorella sp. Hama-1]MDN5361422.1 siroheme decarboxylase [Moorella sp. (in: firmicutes)]BCV22735.1 AsnC family transcriptional regulator [Moorella sp. Hama-1]
MGVSRKMPRQLSELEKAIVRIFQGDLPLEPRPFRRAAAELGLSEEEVLAHLKSLQEEGIMRRFGAALRHRKAGIVANAMVVWRVPEGQAAAAGQKLAAFKEVTHCYQRHSRPEWPYNLYAMIHGRNRRQCHLLAQRLAAAINNHDYQLIFSTAELKKESMRYFEEPTPS